MNQCGACARCGAPIYTESVWHGITPPPSRHSCACFAGDRSVTTTTTGTITLTNYRPQASE